MMRDGFPPHKVVGRLTIGWSICHRLTGDCLRATGKIAISEPISMRETLATRELLFDGWQTSPMCGSRQGNVIRLSI